MILLSTNTLVVSNFFYQGSTEATFTRHRKTFQRIENFDRTSSNITRQYFRSVHKEPAYRLNFKPYEWFYNMPMRRVLYQARITDGFEV